MACPSIQTYSKFCGKGVTGGVQKLFLISYSDLKPVSGSTGVYYTVATDGTVNGIGFNSGKTFSEVGILRENANLKEGSKSDATKNTFENKTEVNFNISDISSTSRKWVSDNIGNEVAVVVQLRSGKYLILGLDGGTTVSEVASDSGTASGDGNGYTVKITGIENDLVRLVDSTYITTKITYAPNI